MLIDRYKNLPEGEAKTLIGMLDPRLQEGLVIEVRKQRSILCPIGGLGDDWTVRIPRDKVVACCDLEHITAPMQSLLNRLSVVMQEEYDHMMDDICEKSIERLNERTTL